MCQEREGQTLPCVQQLQMQDYSFTDVRLDPGPGYERLLAFLNDLHQRLVPEQDQEGENMRSFVITCDNVAIHHLQATTWFEVHPRLVRLFLPPYSPFLNPIEELFSAWRWKVYDHQPHGTGGRARAVRRVRER